MNRSVTFFLDCDDATLSAWRGLQPDLEPERLLLGEDYWVVLTWARLRDAGFPAELANRLPEDGVVVFYAGDKRAVWKQLRNGNRAFLAAIRSDRHPVGFADAEIVQNEASADGARALHVPHWPQPGLIPRDPARGDALRTILFPGTARNLDDGFQSPRWQDFLARHRLAFRSHGDAGATVWNDFGDVDVLLAIRPRAMGLVRNKPAWKLANAWLAGVPAILGPEAGYRELRRGPLDFLEAADVYAAMRALRRLEEEPGLYRAMVENGVLRGRECTTEATARRWVAVLDQLASRHAAWREPPSRTARLRRDAASRVRRFWRRRG